MFTSLIVTIGTVAGILLVGLLAVIPFLLDYLSGRTSVPTVVKGAGVAAGGPRRA